MAARLELLDDCMAGFVAVVVFDLELVLAVLTPVSLIEFVRDDDLDEISLSIFHIP